MRHFHGMQRMRSALGVISRELTLRLLVAAMLGPVVAAVAGWPIYTPLDVPLLLHVAILAAFAVVLWLESRHQRVRTTFSRVSWGALPVLAIAFAALVQARSNVFYTARALMEGMALLMILEVALRMLRRRALVGAIRIAAEDAASGPAPVPGDFNRSLRLARGPSIRVADLLTGVLGWSILASWVLIALEHRHVVGPLLLIAGALEACAVLVLIPDAVAGRAARAGSPAERFRELVRRKHAHIVRRWRPLHSPRSSVYRRLACHLADLRGRLSTTR